MKMEILIETKPSFTEVWHKGHVTFDDKDYDFWLVDPHFLGSKMYIP